MGGSATAGGSIQVQTLDDDGADHIPSTGIPSGAIGDMVTGVVFTIAAADRVAGKAGCSATLMFTPSAGGALSVGSKTITLIYPTSFFAASTVTATLAGVTLSVGSPGPTSLVITVSTGIIALSGAGITLLGLTMGSSATAGGSIHVQTLDGDGADYNPSTGIPSGSIGNMFTGAQTWYMNNISVGRAWSVATSLPLQGLVFIAGGEEASSVFSRVVDVYNASSNTWTAFATALSVGRRSLAAVSLPLEGLAFFAGGCTSHPDITSPVVDVYNASSNTWTAFAFGLSVARSDLAAASLPSQGLVKFSCSSPAATTTVPPVLWTCTTRARTRGRCLRRV